MKKFLATALSAVLLLAFQIPSAAQLSMVSPGNSYKITKILPTSFSSLRGAGTVNVTNSGQTFRMTRIRGTIYKNDKAFLQGTASDVLVKSGTSTLSIDGLASLCEGFSLWSVIKSLSFDLSQYKVDLSTVLVFEDGSTHLSAVTGVPVDKILKAVK